MPVCVCVRERDKERECVCVCDHQRALTHTYTHPARNPQIIKSRQSCTLKTRGHQATGPVNALLQPLPLRQTQVCTSVLRQLKKRAV
mmetsp:Transcript_33784/g.54522  ORF Transcript_33784/g.54522 Transcript_33784/m.54522 type:complete len:87 (-) Transcript_33784:216-476(-)